MAIGKFLLITCLIGISLREIDGHGMMLDPVSRSSAWRKGFSVEPNYDDNGVYCGGRQVRALLTLKHSTPLPSELLSLQLGKMNSCFWQNSSDQRGRPECQNSTWKNKSETWKEIFSYGTSFARRLILNIRWFAVAARGHVCKLMDGGCSWWTE